MVVAVAFLFRTAMRRIQTSGRQWLGGDRGARVSTNVSCPIRPIRRRTIQVLLVMHATLGNDRPTSVHIPITATRSSRMHEAGPGSTRRKFSVDRPPRARSRPAPSGPSFGLTARDPCGKARMSVLVPSSLTSRAAVESFPVFERQAGTPRGVEGTGHPKSTPL